MSLFDESDTNKSEEKTGDFTGVVILAALVPVFFIFRHFGKTDMGLSACVCIGMNLLAIRIRWDLRRHFWFWMVVAVVGALNVPLILIVQWPRAWVPGAVLLPIGLVDLLVTLGAVYFVETFIMKSPSPDESQ